MDIAGMRHIRALTNKSSRMRTTAILSATLSGRKLQPVLVFKGRTKGRIARQLSTEESTLPAGLFYTVQENAWTDETVMLEYIEKASICVTKGNCPVS